ncbi:MAG TPA: SDR family NAD(P)-dependent oxidoreductase [Anaeromyxobacteraceae bacterium]
MAGTVLVVGGTSGLGRALAGQYAAEGWRVVLAGRRADRVAAAAADLRLRHGAEVSEVVFDAVDPSAPARAAPGILAGGPPDVALFALGDNGAPDAALDAAEIARVHAVNFGGAAALLSHLLPALRGRHGAAVAFLSSVAGDRGRRGNFVYGSAKAALNAYAQGLRALLHPDGVSVTTVKLGWLDTRLGYGLAPARLAMSPERAARAVRRAIRARRDVVYVPWAWRLAMLVLRAIPERIFKRLPIP